MPEYATEIVPSELIARLTDLKDLLAQAVNELLEDTLIFRAQVLLNLVSETVIATSDMIGFFDDKRVTYIALATRNILELRIWTDYCIKSDKNAKTFMFDLAKDVFGLAEAFQKLSGLTLDPARLHSLAAEAKTRLKALGEFYNIKVDNKYTRVQDAAKILGTDLLLRYDSLNKATSKFIHPTSLIINTFDPGETSWDWLRIFRHFGLSEASYLADTVGTWIKSPRD